jgi:methylphosphotriester-DNA--protein-cysteine methyltransferase
MAVNWGLAGNGNNALQMFGVGAQMGQNLVDRREAREDRNALLQMRQQEMDARAAERAQAQQQQQQEQRRADLPMLGKLLDFAQDEPTYQRARQIAQEYGVDTSGLPETFDPAWVASQRQVVQLMQTPRGQEALSTAGKQAVDAGLQPGTPEFTAAVRQIITAGMAQPYMGSQGETRLYTPDPFGGGGQAQGGPQPGTVEDGYVFKGGNPADPSSWEPVAQGGPTQPASGGFRP